MELPLIDLDIPYVPSSHNKVNVMMELSFIRKGEMACDLGAGDGRVVIALARRGAIANGFEIEPERVELARYNIKNAKLTDRANIFESSFWEYSLSDYDVITIYGISSMMERLERKLKDELRHGARVVSNCFTFDKWQPTKMKDNVYLYVR